MPGSGRPFAGRTAPEALRASPIGATPWYREPWPWLIMAGPLLVVAASIVTLWLAVRSDDGVVAADYYKRGLLVNQRLPKEAPPPVKVTAEISFAGDEISVRPRGDTVRGDSLRATLVHPATGTRQTLTLVQDSEGAYVGVVPPGPSGAWTVAFDARQSQLPTALVTRK